MDLKEIREKSKKILSNFVDEIDLDGEFYASICNCPMMWAPHIAPGEFVAPDSKRLEGILEKSKLDEKTRRILNQRGLILINQNYRQKEADSDLFVTIIHETIHSNRNLLIFDSIRSDDKRNRKNEYSYSSNNEKLDQNTFDYDFSYADASQEVLKGNIDTSRETVNSYKSTSSEELENMEFAEGKRDSQIKKQVKIDEALVEIMARLAYKLYRNKEKGKVTDIWNVIKEMRDNCKEEYYELKELDLEFGEMEQDTIRAKDRVVMCDILLKHHDFELFNWIIDPISYSQDDIHYDFFEQYTKYDSSLVEKISNDELEVVLDDEYLLELSEQREITSSDIREVAISETAIEELADSFQDISKAQKRANIENVRE